MNRTNGGAHADVDPDTRAETIPATDVGPTAIHPAERSRSGLAVHRPVRDLLRAVPDLAGDLHVHHAACSTPRWSAAGPRQLHRIRQLRRDAQSRDDFWEALWHTIQFTIYTVPPLVILAFVFAVLANRVLRGQWFFRLAFFVPFILPSAAIALIWNFIYTPTTGLWNSFQTLLGVDSPNPVLGTPDLAMIGIAITTIWWTIGFNFVLYLAGLQDIPRELYEAAAVDGATPVAADPLHHHPDAEPDHDPGRPAADHRQPEDLRPGVPDDRRRTGHLDPGAARAGHQHRLHRLPGGRRLGRLGAAVHRDLAGHGDQAARRTCPGTEGA